MFKTKNIKKQTENLAKINEERKVITDECGKELQAILEKHGCKLAVKQDIIVVLN